MNITTNKNPAHKIYSYKPETLETYGRFFSDSEIGKYSSKIKSICDNIINSEGICLIYSEYIDGGIIPMTLALEERGFKRHGKVKSLLGEEVEENVGKYIIISGNKYLSPNNVDDIKDVIKEDNKNGEKIKIVLISRAGAEGLDLKCIRQIHIMEPWYNMNRIEQILGRGVRTCSHILLSLEKRNVQIFLHGTLLKGNKKKNEAADLYVYRRAEEKAIKIGKVTRLLKQNSVDCILNVEQMKFDSEVLDTEIDLILSNNKKIKYKIGDKPFSSMCDYMEKCSYIDNKTLKKYNKILNETELDETTYSENHMLLKIEKIMKLIKNLFKLNFSIQKMIYLAN